MTPWREMMVEAARVGLPPEAFWRLSLKEWRMLTSPMGWAALGRSAFERLAEGWPDE
jgi:uncharacterized phage protein (TIGR02216 family)